MTYNINDVLKDLSIISEDLNTLYLHDEISIDNRTFKTVSQSLIKAEKSIKEIIDESTRRKSGVSPLSKLTYEDQYLNLCKDVLDNGVWIYNKRTGKKVLTKINADFEYDCSKGILPVLTTKKVAYKTAIAEMLGYLRGYNSAEQFRDIGSKTWDANSNAESWQNSEACKGPDDMGYCYGELGRRFITPSGKPYDQLEKIYSHLKNGIDDRGEILTFIHPGTDHLSCLRACMHTHTFSVVGDTLHLTSYQRSADIPLGLPFNMVQVAWLLMIMAKITGLKPGTAYHKMVNVHIYEDQIPGITKQISRTPLPSPQVYINFKIKTLCDLMEENDTCTLMDYFHQGYIEFPFSV